MSKGHYYKFLVSDNAIPELTLKKSLFLKSDILFVVKMFQATQKHVEIMFEK